MSELGTPNSFCRLSEKHYFSVLENVVSTRVRESAMKPRVSPDFNGDRATIDVRQELLANLFQFT